MKGNSQHSELPRLQRQHREQEETNHETCCGTEIAGREGEKSVPSAHCGMVSDFTGGSVQARGLFAEEGRDGKRVQRMTQLHTRDTRGGAFRTPAPDVSLRINSSPGPVTISEGRSRGGVYPTRSPCTGEYPPSPVPLSPAPPASRVLLTGEHPRLLLLPVPRRQL